MKLSILLITILFSVSGFAFRQMDDRDLNERLQSCLDSLGCTLGKTEVSRGEGARCGSGRSPWSCHLVDKAIDIYSAKCKGKPNNHESLKALASCLQGWNFLNYTACYSGAGPCIGGHGDHLHFGFKEWKCKSEIRARMGEPRCNN